MTRESGSTASMTSSGSRQSSPAGRGTTGEGREKMSEEPKGTAALQAEIAREFRNMKSQPGLEIGLRPELGTFELCDKHYDASKTECEEHCAVCKQQTRTAELEAENLSYEKRENSYIAQIDTLTAENKALREAAYKYSDNGHFNDCAIYLRGTAAGNCSCGLDALAALLEKESKSDI
jgi:hypothetical protein